MMNYSTYVTMAFIPRAAHNNYSFIIMLIIFVIFYGLFKVDQNMLWLMRVDLGK